VAEEAQGEAHVSAEQPQTSEAARLPRPHADPGRPVDPANPAPEGPRAPLGLIGRVGDRATFDALRRDGRRARRGPMTVAFLPGGTDVRVAYAIGRRVGPAVVRNRVRRRLREAVRELDRTTPGGLACGAYLVSVRPEAAARTYRDLRDDLARGCAAVTGEVPR
jgi:ribonuclease P protein component